MRRIPMQGDPNFWDFGGYRIDETLQTAEGLLYRSGRLSRLSGRDWDVFAELNIRTVIDLRSHDEVEEAPDPVEKLQEMDVQYRNMPIAQNGLGKQQVVDLFRQAAAGRVNIHQHMTEAYRGIPDEFAPQMKKICRILLQEDAYPILFHCTAGKDRTGYVAAVLLGMLGADESLIRKDYLSYERQNLPEAAARYAESFREYGIEVDHEHTHPYLKVEEAYIDAMLDAVRGKWGSMMQYAEEKLEMHDCETAELREILLAYE